MDMPRIAIIMSTTREGRFAEKPAHWLKAIADQRSDLAFEVIDLRDFPLPFFDESSPPAATAPKEPVAREWAARIRDFDGYIFITAEYNHGYSAVLKNALDYAYTEWNRKPASFLAYGGVGGARAVEQLRLVCVELQMAALRNAVHIGREQFGPVAKGEKQLSDFPALEKAATGMLDELSWWTKTLKAGRAENSGMQ
jgi:NAD(P)H-dependent FMN reductase